VRCFGWLPSVAMERNLPWRTNARPSSEGRINREPCPLGGRTHGSSLGGATLQERRSSAAFAKHLQNLPLLGRAGAEAPSQARRSQPSTEGGSAGPTGFGGEAPRSQPSNGKSRCRCRTCLPNRGFREGNGADGPSGLDATDVRFP
jgi:hypothetical protein